MTALAWGLLGLLAGVLSAWLTVLLLVHPLRARGVPGILDLQGPVSAHAPDLARFASEHLLVALPAPRHFFEQLGPDRFRREFGRTLKSRIDEHVDDVMERRTGRVWSSLSTYARNRVYAHVHRRLPYVIDDFVDNLQAELDDLVQPPALVQRHVAERPETVAAVFLGVFGADLRAALPLAALGGLVAALACGLLLSPRALPLLLPAAAAGAGSLVMLLALTRPELPGGIWPWRAHGILFRRRERFLRELATRVANEALDWRVLAGEFFAGPQAGRVRLLLRREVNGILEAPVFKATLQFLVGAEGVVAVKTSAVEKAMELLATSPVSAALREHYRVEVERTLLRAADEVDPAAYAGLWQLVLRRARWLPVVLAAATLVVAVLVHLAVAT